MTKHRAPLSYDRAIARIAALIGYDEMARVTGRAVRTVRKRSSGSMVSFSSSMSGSSWAAERRSKCIRDGQN